MLEFLEKILFCFEKLRKLKIREFVNGGRHKNFTNKLNFSCTKLVQCIQRKSTILDFICHV